MEVFVIRGSTALIHVIISDSDEAIVANYGGCFLNHLE